MTNLPASWAVAGIEDALLPFENNQTLRQGWSPQCELFPAQSDDHWGVLKTTAIQDGEFQPEHNKQLPSKLEPDTLLEVKVGDLLLTCAGPRVRCGVICLVRKTRPRLMISGKMYRFRTEKRIALPAYLEAFLRSHDTKKRIDAMKTGISDSGLNLTLSRFKTLEVPLPPPPEQRRIVAKIEELFSELDKGIENLKQARAQLAVYRQALLKHAFEGHLTADWRTQHAQELESAEQLLARIRAEREERYQKQLIEWKLVKAKGGECSKPRELTPWAELSASEPAELPPLPAGWTWIPFSNLCQVIRNGISAKPTGDTGDKILRISAVRPMKVDLDDFRYIQGTGDDYEDYALEVGDLLFTRYNGSRKFVGVCGHFRGSERRLFPDKLIQGRFGVEAVLPEFVEAAFSSGASRKFVESRIRTTAGQAGVSGGDIKAVPVPVCSLAEQKEIVRFLEESLPNIAAIEADIDQNLQKAEALRQSILKKAFAGELVPQDSADEPAAALLARIRAERAATTKPARRAKPPCPAA